MRESMMRFSFHTPYVGRWALASAHGARDAQLCARVHLCCCWPWARDECD